MTMVEMPPTLADARHDLADEWRDAAPRTPAEIANFYRFATGIRDDLDAWHATDERRAITKGILYVAKTIDARMAVDIGCGAGHDLTALRDFGLRVAGVEPNRFLRDALISDDIDCLDRAEDAPIESADLLVCIDVLEHVPDPESFLTGIATRAKANAVLIETTATHDIGTPLHLESNRGWHPGRCLESHGWAKIESTGRMRVWQKVADHSLGVASMILVAHRTVTISTYQALKQLDPRCWRQLEKDGDALVDRARSSVASQWWRETADDVFVMVDDDIEFDAAGAERLVQRCREGLDIVCAAYPVRDGSHFALQTLHPMTLHFGADAEPVEIRWAGTGFIAVHRRVLDALIPTLPLCHPDQEWSFWPMFLPMIHTDEDGLTTELSEDWAFCERARSLGFKVWLDGSVRVRHRFPIPVDAANMTAVHAAIKGR